MGEITVQFIFGHPVVAPLSTVGIQYSAEPGTTNITSELPVVCAVVEVNANEYGVILPPTVLKELQQVPVVSVNVVGVPITHSSDVESVVACDCNCLFTAVQDSSKTVDRKDDVLSAEFDNHTVQLTHNESQGTDDVTVLIEEQKLMRP